MLANSSSTFLELPGGVLVNVSHLDTSDIVKLFGKEALRARSEEVLTPTKPKGVRQQRPQKKDCLPTDDASPARRCEQVMEGFELGRKDDPSVEALSFLPTLSQCSSVKQYVRERTEILRICSPMRCAMEEHLLTEVTKQAEQRTVSRGDGSVASRDRHHLHLADRTDRHQVVLDNRRRVLLAERAHVVAALEQSDERIRKAAEGKAAAQVSQELARRWFSVVFIVKTALKLRECRQRGYAVKWKSIALYLIAKHWRKRVVRRRRRLGELKLNLILRRHIPAVAERLRETKRKVFLATVKRFLFDCAVTKRIPNIVHTFLAQVKRAQRVVRRKQLAVRLQSSAMLLALNDAFSHQELESRFTPTPEFVRAETCLRLTRKDRELAAAEKRDFQEKLQNEIDAVDKVESQRADAVLLGQSIVVHSSLITLVRCVPLSKVHRLQRLALTVEHERTVSPELRDTFKRWFAQFYLRFLQLAGAVSNNNGVPIKRTSDSYGGPSGAGRFPFLNPEGEDKFLLDALARAQAEGCSSPPSSLATSRGGSLIAMARACSQYTVPFLNKSDLVWSVLSQVSIPQRPRRRRLLAAQTMSALAKVLRDEWDKACRAAMEAAGAEVVSGGQDPRSALSIPPSSGALDTAVEENTAMLQSMALSYSASILAERSISRDVLLSHMDWSFLDKFYRRVR